MAATIVKQWSRCDSCGTGTPDEVGPILIGCRGWRGFHIDGVRNGVPWEGAVWVCPHCAPDVAAGRAPIRTFLGGATTEPTMAEFVERQSPTEAQVSQREEA